jgi:predicted Zn finger-like uncharacterized protein
LEGISPHPVGESLALPGHSRRREDETKTTSSTLKPCADHSEETEWSSVFCGAATHGRNGRSESDYALQGDLGLIVTCDECSTSFQLDESRIPASGAQVRCSRCKHAFFLPNPSASQSQVADSIAEEAAQDPMPGVPPIVSDAPDVASTAGASEPDLEPDEEDWQFSEEVRIEGDEDLEPESDFGVSQDFGSDFDPNDLLDEDIEDAIDQSDPGNSSAENESVNLNPGSTTGLELDSDPEPVEPVESVEPVRDESDFGSVDDFSSLMEDDDISPENLGAEIESELEAEDSVERSASVYTESGQIDDLGDPESWDLVGNHDLSASKSTAGSTGTSFRDDVLGSGITAEDESGRLSYDEDLGPKSRLWQGLARVGHGVGWVATIAFVIGVLGLGLRSEWTRLDQSPQTASVGAMTAETTRASWVETSRSGFILVVDGEVRNSGNVPLWPGTVQLALLDASGKRLTGPPIQAGEQLAESVLREAAPYELIASAATAASDLRERPLSPGESRAFEAIVLENHLPEGARRLLLEVGDSEISVERVEPLEGIEVAEAESPVEEESYFSP